MYNLKFTNVGEWIVQLNREVSRHINLKIQNSVILKGDNSHIYYIDIT